MTEHNNLVIGRIDFINCDINGVTAQKLRGQLPRALEKLSLQNTKTGIIEKVTIDASRFHLPSNAHDLAELLASKITAEISQARFNRGTES